MTVVPEYRRIRKWLRSLLESGEFQPGDRVPTERELAARFGVAHMTVRHAVDGLVREGMLVRRRGSGTFVVRTRAVSRSVNRLQSFSEDVPGTRTDVILQREAQPPEDVAEMLECSVHVNVVELVRVRKFDGKPLALHHVWVPLGLAPDLARIDMTDRSLYTYLAEQEAEVDHAEQKIYAAAVSEEEAEHLKIAPGSPVLGTERIARTVTNVPVEVARSLALPHIPILMELRR